MSYSLWGCLLPCGLDYWCDKTTSSSSSSSRMTGGNMGAQSSSELQQQQSGATTVQPLAGSSSASGVMIRAERRKKVAGFATLKKKLIRRRRSSKACDHGRVLREFVSNWSPIELSGLLEEYEALAALKDLSVQAELARPPAATFKQDLCALYDYRYCTDCELVFRGNVSCASFNTVSPVSILSRSFSRLSRVRRSNLSGTKVVASRCTNVLITAALFVHWRFVYTRSDPRRVIVAATWRRFWYTESARARFALPARDW